MPRQEVNIGVEGNDGTGDSIRASFNKVNENFIELYAVFGIEGQIRFTNLSDTPDTLTANTVPLVNSAGTAVNLVTLASNSALDSSATDSIQFSYDTAGKLIITSGFGSVADDLSPALGGPLDAGGHGIANVAISDSAAANANTLHTNLTNITIDDLVITKGYADQRYVTAAVPISLDGESSGVLNYSWTINSYVDNTVEITSYYDTNQNLQSNSHGLDASSNGKRVVFKQIGGSISGAGFTNNTNYYIRIITTTRIMLFADTDAGKAASTKVSDTDAAADSSRIMVAGTIGTNDTHTITLAAYDATLTGNYLSDEPVPRRDLVLRTGDTMTGALLLDDHPGDFAGTPRLSDSQEYRAATKFYVDNSGYSSPEVIYVSTKGDDFMRNAPVGKEGTSKSYAFKTINAAAQRAETLIATAPINLGPYAQKLTKTVGSTTTNMTTMAGRFKTAVFNNARNILQNNKEYIQKETTSYIAKLYPDYVYDVARCQKDLGLIVDAIALDINSGLNANNLTRTAARRYYSTVSGKRAITAQLPYTKAAFTFAKYLSSQVLQNKLDTLRADYRSYIGNGTTTAFTVAFNTTYGVRVFKNKILQIAGTDYNTNTANTVTFTTAPADGDKITLHGTTAEGTLDISAITVSSDSSTAAIITTTGNHGLTDKDVVVIREVTGMTQINDVTVYIKSEAANQFSLYKNSNLDQPYSTNGFSAYSSGGKVGLRYQLNEAQYFVPSTINITAATKTLPVTVTTNGFHYLDDNETITIANTVGMSQINQSNLIVRRVNDTSIQLYSAAFDAKSISNITANNTEVVVTAVNHGLTNGDTVVFTGIQGMTELNNTGPTNSTLFHVGDKTDNTFKLYTDSNLNVKVNTLPSNQGTLSNYTQGGTVTRNALDGRAFGTYASNGVITKAQDASSAARSAIDTKWALLINIIENGIDASGTGQVFGNEYQIVVENGNSGFVDQTISSNKDAIAGKVIRGRRSDARGLIVQVDNDVTAESATYNGVTQSKPTVFSVNLLEPRDFEVGEELEFGNKAVKKQCVIEVEAGHYEEDYPIRITKNVSLKGDEFRRVVISPAKEADGNKARISQSKYAKVYFYRDNTFDGLTLTDNSGTTFLNQSGIAQGRFGYHYQADSGAVCNMDNGVTITNLGQFTVAHDIIKANRDYLVEEAVNYLTQYNLNTTIVYPDNDKREDFRYIVDAVANDLRLGGEENSLEIQGYLYGKGLNTATKTAVAGAIVAQKALVTSLLAGAVPPNTTVELGTNDYTPNTQTIETAVVLRSADYTAKTGESGTNTIADKLLDRIAFFNNAAYKPTKRNDEIDVFLMDDTTVIRNVTCRGHGGFMGVLDPDGQILTKSPYIQNATSFSKSLGNRKNFAGGMYIDAYTGNLPVKIVTYDDTSGITGTNGYTRVNVKSDAGQGLFRRPPQLPCPFFIEGRRYTVTAVTLYDQANGTAILHIDPNSDDGNGYDPSRLTDTTLGATDASDAKNRPIFLQTAGNRSMLANGFTQVNDLGYGTVATNGGLSEQVSQFSYYTQAAMYANNGSEIRALNCSSGYGNFGLVAEGADPNEIPDQVVLKNDMPMPLKVFSGTIGSTTFTAASGDTNIVVYENPTTKVPLPLSIITINHGGTTGRLNYKISSVTDVTGLNSNHVASGQVVNNRLYRLTLQVDNVITDDFFGSLQATVPNGTLIEYRDNFQVIYDLVRSPSTLTSRPSTAVNYDESDDVTYRTLDFSAQDPYGAALANDEVRTTLEVPYDHIELTAADYEGLSNPAQQGYLIAPNVSTSGSFPEQRRLRPKVILQGLTANTVVIPENTTVTQATSGITGKVAFDVAIGSTEITLYNTSGTFNTTNTVSYTVSSTTYTVGVPSSPIKETDGMKFVWQGRTHRITDVKPLTTLKGLNANTTGTVAVNTVITQGSATGKVAIQAASGTDILHLYDVSGTFATSGQISGTNAGTGVPGSVITTHTKYDIINDGTDIVSGITGTGLSAAVPTQMLTFGSAVSVTAGGTITQATSNATAKIASTTNTTFVEIYDVVGTFNTTNQISTHSNVVPTKVTAIPQKLFAGLPGGTNSNKNATAEITVKISITRASNHDFVQIGTGGFNDSNYPSNIYGDPINALATFYTDSGSATTAQVYEKRKGRVFFVSTDQFGFFRVGKFFNVDQGTGKITFAGDLGISNADALGFKKGVTIDEFSPDEAMTDESGTAVPTEQAVVKYINRRLGLDGSGSTIGNKIGPGFLPLNGALAMTGDLNAGSNKITNVSNPTNGTDAANKAYVDSNSGAFRSISALRDWGYRTDGSSNKILPADDELIVSTGNKIIYTAPESGTTFAEGQYIGLSNSPTPSASTNPGGTIVEIVNHVDGLYGSSSVRKIVYVPTSQAMTVSEGTTIYSSGGGSAVAKANPGPYDEITHAKAKSSTDININVEQTANETTVDLQIAAGSILNADINSSAGITQSKLALNAATLRANATGIAQTDLGVAAFHSAQFSATNGFIELQTSNSTTNGIAPEKLQHIGAGTVLGRASGGGDGAVSAISASTFLSAAGGLTDTDFNYGSSSGSQVMIKSATGTYGLGGALLDSTNTSSALNSTVAKRTSSGQLQATGFVLGTNSAYEVLSGSGTQVDFKTPEGETFLQASGSTTPTLPKFLGNLNVGVAGSLTISTNQAASGSAYNSEGALYSNWLYTKGIEAVDHGTGNKTGIVFGNNGGFSDDADDSMIFYHGGSARYKFTGTDTGGSILPLGTTNTKNIGSTSQKFNTVYASTFNGLATSAQYADLAEKYLADADYPAGTVLIFGGDKELTVTDKLSDTKVAGVVSANPGFIMNEDLQGNHVTKLALQGRVMCKVIGRINKGDMIVTSAVPGYGIASDLPGIGTVIGKAVGVKTTDIKGEVEIVVGRI